MKTIRQSLLHEDRTCAVAASGRFVQSPTLVRNGHFRVRGAFLISRIVAFAIIPTLALAMSYAEAAPTSPFTQSTVPNGSILVNQVNGEIFQCAVVSQAGRPVGKCSQIGSVAVSSATDTIQIISSSSSSAAVIADVTNGAVAECVVSTNATTGTPLGSCIEGLAPQVP